MKICHFPAYKASTHPPPPPRSERGSSSGLYYLFIALVHARLSDFAPSHLPASDECDVTPSEAH